MGRADRVRADAGAAASASLPAGRRSGSSFRAMSWSIPTGHEQVRANDTNYRFRPGTDFYYLTGIHEPDCVLVLVPDGDAHRAIVFTEPNPGKTDSTFFTDRSKGELWVGPRLGVAATAARFGVEAPADRRSRHVSERHDGLASRAVAARSSMPAPRRAVVSSLDNDNALAAALSELRLIKDDLEIAELRAAIAATKRGFDDVVRALPAAVTERVVEGVFNLRARVEGNDVGYSTIAASGPDACILHWVRNDRRIECGDVLLLDAGVEAVSLYTADVTRTLPVSGRSRRRSARSTRSSGKRSARRSRRASRATIFSIPTRLRCACSRMVSSGSVSCLGGRSAARRQALL